MPTKYTVTLSYMGTSSVIAIPKPIVDGFRLKRGQKLELFVTDDKITIPMHYEEGKKLSTDTAGEA